MFDHLQNICQNDGIFAPVAKLQYLYFLLAVRVKLERLMLLLHTMYQLVCRTISAAIYS